MSRDPEFAKQTKNYPIQAAQWKERFAPATAGIAILSDRR